MTVTQIHEHLRLRDEPPAGCVSSIEVCRRAGISYRQLDYWTRTDLLHPIGGHTPGSGSWRWYPVDQVHRAALIQVLLTGGLSLQAVRDFVDDLMVRGTVRIHPSLHLRVVEED